MKRMRKYVSMGLAMALLGGASLLYAPNADAGVRIVRRGAACTAPGYYVPGQYLPGYQVRPQHVHTYAYQQQKIFIGYDACGYPVYEIRYVQIRTCGCR